MSHVYIGGSGRRFIRKGLYFNLTLTFEETLKDLYLFVPNCFKCVEINNVFARPTIRVMTVVKGSKTVL